MRPSDDNQGVRVFNVRLGAAVPTALSAALLAAPGAGAGSPTPVPDWAAAQIATVTAQGIFTGTPATFRPEDPLTAGALADAVAALTGDPAAQPADPTAQVTVAELDTALVRALGLGAAAHRFFTAARDAGLAPPTRFGTETVARLLGLRFDHPAAQDALELQPGDVATRAEAAYAAARALALLPGQLQAIDAASKAFAPPQVTGPARELLHTAVSLIGFPYVWAGTSEKTGPGFDCSGFVWRVFKLQRYADAPGLGDVLVGRSTEALSGEVPQSRRLDLASVQPADVLFFGAGGPTSRPQDVSHAGIALGGGWFIHAGSQGVSLASLTDVWATTFAWARRPLAEAGIAGSRS